MRCTGYATEAECKQWEPKKEQVSPDTTSAPPSPSPALSAPELETLKQQAKSLGTYWPSGKCPATLEATNGLPTYIEGPCKLKYEGGVGNSQASPGFLVLVNGTFELGGNAEFYGVIYAVNQQNSSGAVVVIGGNAHLHGAIDVDGNGGIEFGASKENFVYNPKAISEVKAYSGATPTRNTFRVLPSGQ